MTPLSPTERTRIRRLPERGSVSREALYRILDEGRICHLGVTIDGTPRVIPTAYGRAGDTLYLHGSTGAVSMRGATADVCVTVTLLDGLVLARSLMHHSMNYRSALIFGTPRTVTDRAEKLAGLRAIVENLVPGRWDEAREPSAKELAATAVLALSLAEASVKTRQGPPNDDEADLALDAWAGVVPVRTVLGDPSPDPLLRPGTPLPAALSGA
ncbi:pyridoxamine 5'-phosphate oxidase family protein [Actinomadura rayongensis]|uniref:Pyridoxamine 5'-phosphate oxidase family protein n=1 Tax=Actinomadura rayongensis TaxID=1429076 RepID=A0A6I4W8L0_9ACTN|nr:pyridoxamine 5'-phosphate oxidase family protein [Actinomadura rayongensis]MXQ65978.1 pyridoxamine 5'-phosphate oxidase family protein [Actinomadura rayongensis]